MNDTFVKETDMLIHAGHSLSAYAFDLGAKENTIFRFQKRYPNNKIAEIDLIVPIGKTDLSAYTLSKTELAELYAKIQKEIETSLFVFVTSCNVPFNSEFWSVLYRDALVLNNEGNEITRQDFPYVMAPNRSFDTDNILAIVSHVFYPMDAVDMVMRGKSVQDIYEYLQVYKYGSFFIEMGKRIVHSNKKSFSNVRRELEDLRSIFPHQSDEENTYNPVYNLSPENKDRILRLGGHHFVIEALDSHEILLDYPL